MQEIDETWVRNRAYEIWEAAGRPEGKDADHWFKATEEFLAMEVPASRPKPSQAPVGMRANPRDKLQASSTMKKRSRAFGPKTS